MYRWKYTVYSPKLRYMFSCKHRFPVNTTEAPWWYRGWGRWWYLTLHSSASSCRHCVRMTSPTSRGSSRVFFCAWEDQLTSTSQLSRETKLIIHLTFYAPYLFLFFVFSFHFKTTIMVLLLFAYKYMSDFQLILHLTCITTFCYSCLTLEKKKTICI